MAAAAKRGRKAGSPGRKDVPGAEPAKMSVRMLVGPYAGRVVQVSRQQGAELCSGWQPQAEPVGSAPARTRETR